jgi:hypothetical protein
VLARLRHRKNISEDESMMGRIVFQTSNREEKSQWRILMDLRF